MVEARRLLVGLVGLVGLVALLALAPFAAGAPLPAPPPLVPNPVAEAWAALEPGAWVRYTLFDRAPGTDLLVPNSETEMIQVLVEKTEHEVVLQRGFDEVVNGKPALRWVWTQFDRLERKAERTAALGSAFQDREALVTEGRASRDVAGKQLVCTTLEAKVSEEDSIKVWLHASVPGGVVRLERASRKGAGPPMVTQANEVLSSGTKPDGRFPWPLPPDADHPWVEQEVYLGWARHPAGSWVRYVTTSKLANKPAEEPWRETETLLEARPTRVDLTSGYVEGRLLWRSTFRWEHPLEPPRHTKVEETTAASETLVVDGKSLVCSVRRRVRTSIFATVTETAWLNPNVPGGVVQLVTHDKPGMDERETRNVVEAFGVREVEAPARPPEPARVTAPPALVPNPIAEAWAALKPGAWARYQVFTVDLQTRKLVPAAERLRVLVQVNAHDVVVREREGALGGGKKEMRWVFDQTDRIDRRVEPLGIFHPAFDAWLDMKITEGKETRTVAGKAVECRTLEAGDGDPLGRRFKLWLAPGVPGAVVREEWSVATAKQADQPVSAFELLASGAKPDGSFPWPIPAGKPWVEQENYLRWAKTPVGSWIRQTEILSSAKGDDPPRSEMLTLLEVRPTRVILEVAEGDRVFVRDLQRWQYPPGDAGEYKVEELKSERPKETLAVGEKRLECTVRRRRYKSPFGAPTVTEWSNPTVPGGVVQTVTVDSIGGTEHVLRTFVENFGGPP